MSWCSTGVHNAHYSCSAPTPSAATCSPTTRSPTCRRLICGVFGVVLTRRYYSYYSYINPPPFPTPLSPRKASLSPAPPPPCPRTRIFAPHSLVGAAYLSEHNTARNIIDAASSVRHPSDAHLLQPPRHLLLRIGPHAAHVSAHTRMLYMCPHTRTCLREEEAAAMREGHKSSPTCVFAHSKS